MNKIQAQDQNQFTIRFDEMDDPIGLLQFLKLNVDFTKNSDENATIPKGKPSEKLPEVRCVRLEWNRGKQKIS